MQPIRRLVPGLLWTLIVAGFLVGCTDDEIHFHDDMDLVFDFKPLDPFHPPPDDLHLPYVIGAQFGIYAFRDHDKMDLSDSTVSSEDSNVMEVGTVVASDAVVDFRCRAVSPGSTEIVVWRGPNSPRTWGRAFVEVAAPAKAELTFAGPLFIDASRDEYRVRGAVNVLVGGTATFLAWVTHLKNPFDGHSDWASHRC